MIITLKHLWEHETKPCIFHFYPHSSSCNSISKWRSLWFHPAALRLLRVWSDPHLSWLVLDLDHQVTCLLHQEGCPCLRSHLVHQVLLICLLRCPCPRCPWGHRLPRDWCLICDLSLACYDFSFPCHSVMCFCRFIQFSYLCKGFNRFYTFFFGSYKYAGQTIWLANIWTQSCDLK